MPEGIANVPKITKLGPFQKSITASPTKARITLDTSTVSNIDNYVFSIGTSEYVDGSSITWEDATHDTLTTLSSVQGKFVWVQIIGTGDTITIPDRGTANTPIKIEVV